MKQSYVNPLLVAFCDMSQKAIDITGYGPRSCGVICIIQNRYVQIALVTIDIMYMVSHVTQLRN